MCKYHISYRPCGALKDSKVEYCDAQLHSDTACILHVVPTMTREGPCSQCVAAEEGTQHTNEEDDPDDSAACDAVPAESQSVNPMTAGTAAATTPNASDEKAPRTPPTSAHATPTTTTTPPAPTRPPLPSTLPPRPQPKSQPPALPPAPPSSSPPLLPPLDFFPSCQPISATNGTAATRLPNTRGGSSHFKSASTSTAGSSVDMNACPGPQGGFQVLAEAGLEWVDWVGAEREARERFRVRAQVGDLGVGRLRGDGGVGRGEGEGEGGLD